MKERTMLKHNGVCYTDSLLYKIGNEVAALWGASCYSYKIDEKAKAVFFYCIEHGEKFIAETDFEELQDFLG